MLRDFTQVEFLGSQRSEGYGQWKMSLQSFPRVMSLMNGKASTISMTMVFCLVLDAIIEQLNKIGDAATSIGIDNKAIKNKKV